MSPQTPRAPLPFKLDEATEAKLSSLNEHQRRQLDAALTYHALRSPGRVLSINLAVGSIAQIPALTDQGTIDGSATAGATTLASFEITSTAVGSVPDKAPATRHIRLSHPDSTPATVEPIAPFSIPRQVYRVLERRAPVVLDSVREAIMKRRSRAIASVLPRYPENEAGRESAQIIETWGRSALPAPEATPRAILFGLHWLQTGGAERWAIESVRLAREAGFLPVIVTDQNSVHPWLTRPELEGAVVITMSFNEHLHTLDLGLAHAILENYDIRGVVLHHSQWLYLCLPWIKSQRPDLEAVDSLHIVEYLGGGYPGISAQYDAFVDTHHVISPQLHDWLTRVQGVAAEKIAMAPLSALTVDETGEFSPRDPAKPLTISFIGRLSRQKRPDLFLALVHRLRKRGVRFHAIMQGDGEMREVVEGLIDRFRLRGVIEQRFEDVPVADTLAVSDVLVITSINEGLTLTTFEALAAGIPVISTDVGSQYTLVDGDMLLPRPARAFIRKATAKITALERSDQDRFRAWQGQRDRMREFGAHTDAHHFMKELFRSWQA